LRNNNDAGWQAERYRWIRFFCCFFSNPQSAIRNPQLNMVEACRRAGILLF